LILKSPLRLMLKELLLVVQLETELTAMALMEELANSKHNSLLALVATRPCQS